MVQRPAPQSIAPPGADSATLHARTPTGRDHRCSTVSTHTAMVSGRWSHTGPPGTGELLSAPQGGCLSRLTVS